MSRGFCLLKQSCCSLPASMTKVLSLLALCEMYHAESRTVQGLFAAPMQALETTHSSLLCTKWILQRLLETLNPMVTCRPQSQELDSGGRSSPMHTYLCAMINVHHTKGSQDSINTKEGGRRVCEPRTPDSHTLPSLKVFGL